jgi:hypothetical protein
MLFQRIALDGRNKNQRIKYRHPDPNLGISSSASLEKEDDKRICCLFDAMKVNYDEYLKNNKAHCLHSGTCEDIKNKDQFTLTNITSNLLEKTERHWG